jgi:pyruvate/2-oxoglutarate dehydrogenase complex dihydrolipoamide dehydrogenase (E3) component
MAVEYDWVILGGTAEGQAAAQRAATYGARVAWVLQELPGLRSHLESQVAWQALSPYTMGNHTAEQLAAWQHAQQQIRLTARILTQTDAADLLRQGVDVIAEKGKLVGDRPLQIMTPTRSLSTRGLLLATGSQPSQATIPGISSVPSATPEEFLQQTSLPESVVIIGAAPSGLTLAQLLTRWGVAVTVVTMQSSLLPWEDPAITQWLQAQLQTEGVKLHLGVEVMGIAATPTGQVRVNCHDRLVIAEALVVAGKSVTNLAGIGLESWLGHDRPLLTNQFLQTHHPRIYACGSVMGGAEAPAIARHEAHLATDNGLFWNRQRINYHALPYSLPTQPEMARVGYTEPQARKRYGNAAILVTQIPWYATPKAHWYDSTVGFCKLIAHRHGPILGAHGVGPEASEWIQAIALTMQHRIPWFAIAQTATLPDSLTDILQQTAYRWECDRWQPGQWRRDWAENWFNWRRSR